MKIQGNMISTPTKPEKNLLKATDLTPEEQAQARANIGAASADVVGDIEAALDELHAYAQALVSGGGA
jgi:hypothetical protein